MGQIFDRSYREDGMKVDETIELSDRHAKSAMMQIISEAEAGITDKRIWEILKNNADRIEITKEL